jgi:hypothetical protein
MIELASRSIPENTKRKAMWAYRMFDAWSQWRQEISQDGREMRLVDKILLVYKSEIHMMPEVDLNEVLHQFIAEVRKDGGERYPGKTLYEIISSLQKYLELKGRSVNFFSSLEFEKVRKSLDVEMKCSAQNNVGIRPKQAEVIPVEVERDLWEQGFLATNDPESLLRTVFYLIGLTFGLRAGSEHRVLSMSSFSFHTDNRGKEYLLYSEGVSKTFQGGLKHRKVAPRTGKAYANVECADKCIVNIVKLYISRCPKEGLRKAFYLKPLQNYERKQIWFSSVPIGHNKLQGMVKCIMEKAGVNGHFTNHSLRATAVSRLFREGVDDKLIKGVTGHRSEALDCYKRETEEQHANVSKIVQGITSEKGATAESSAPIEKGDDGMGSVVLNISGGNCNITIVNKP